jgi:hypothetical protein
MSDGWFEANGRGQVVDCASLFDSKASDLVWEIVQLGGLVSIGTTRDGGACGVTVTADSKWRREYFRETDELIPWLVDATTAVRLRLGTPESPKVATTRKRSAKTL